MSEAAAIGTRVVDLATLEAYSRAAADPNPIHLDAAAARAQGLPGIIAHGMLSAAWLIQAALEDRAGRGVTPASIRSYQVRFRAMAELGDELTLVATADHRYEARNARGEIVASLTLTSRA